MQAKAKKIWWAHGKPVQFPAPILFMSIQSPITPAGVPDPRSTSKVLLRGKLRPCLSVSHFLSLLHVLASCSPSVSREGSCSSDM